MLPGASGTTAPLSARIGGAITNLCLSSYCSLSSSSSSLSALSISASIISVVQRYWFCGNFRGVIIKFCCLNIHYALVKIDSAFLIHLKFD